MSSRAAREGRRGRAPILPGLVSRTDPAATDAAAGLDRTGPAAEPSGPPTADPPIGPEPRVIPDSPDRNDGPVVIPIGPRAEWTIDSVLDGLSSDARLRIETRVDVVAALPSSVLPHCSAPVFSRRVKDRIRLERSPSSARSSDRGPARRRAAWPTFGAARTDERPSRAAPSRARGNTASRDPHPRRLHQCPGVSGQPLPPHRPSLSSPGEGCRVPQRYSAPG